MIGFLLSNLLRVVTTTADGGWLPMVGLLTVAACVGCIWRAR